MPGKKSVSERFASWQVLTLEESGGYTGLRRGCSLQRASLHAPQAARVAELLAQLGPPPAKRAAQYPDCQSLRVEMDCVPQAGSAAWAFDTAELPAAIDELLALAPPLRPLPPPQA